MPAIHKCRLTLQAAYYNLYLYIYAGTSSGRSNCYGSKGGGQVNKYKV